MVLTTNKDAAKHIKEIIYRYSFASFIALEHEEGGTPEDTADDIYFLHRLADALSGCETEVLIINS